MAFLYRIDDISGNFLKWGKARNPFTRYSTKSFFRKDLVMQIISWGSEADILDMERSLTERYPGPLNFEPWAGKNWVGKK